MPEDKERTRILGAKIKIMSYNERCLRCRFKKRKKVTRAVRVLMSMDEPIFFCRLFSVELQKGGFGNSPFRHPKCIKSEVVEGYSAEELQCKT